MVDSVDISPTWLYTTVKAAAPRGHFSILRPSSRRALSTSSVPAFSSPSRSIVMTTSNPVP